jgi:hypothetical protein
MTQERVLRFAAGSTDVPTASLGSAVQSSVRTWTKTMPTEPVLAAKPACVALFGHLLAAQYLTGLGGFTLILKA